TDRSAVPSESPRLEGGDGVLGRDERRWREALGSREARPERLEGRAAPALEEGLRRAVRRDEGGERDRLHVERVRCGVRRGIHEKLEWRPPELLGERARGLRAVLRDADDAHGFPSPRLVQLLQVRPGELARGARDLEEDEEKRESVRLGDE